ncbi:MAG: ACT domain-containing protein [Bifidobacteriaceae bacterium]|jgi:hypothetical protein|nr:ACT domain-containing protein [Bifidobacteriaceae bacterium]
MRALELELLPGRFTVAKLTTPAHAALLLGSAQARPAFVAATAEEVSVVCPTAAMPRTHLKRDDGWALARVRGQLDFTLVGVLANLTATLAEAGVPVFAVSTFDTDYLLVKAVNLERAGRALAAAGIALYRPGAQPGPAPAPAPAPAARGAETETGAPESATGAPAPAAPETAPAAPAPAAPETAPAASAPETAAPGAETAAPEADADTAAPAPETAAPETAADTAAPETAPAASAPETAAPGAETETAAPESATGAPAPTAPAPTAPAPEPAAGAAAL